MMRQLDDIGGTNMVINDPQSYRLKAEEAHNAGSVVS